MLKSTFAQGIRLKKRVPWVLALLLWLVTTATAGTSEPHDMSTLSVGVGAPFLPSWAGVWFFAFMGGLSTIFFKIPNIDSNFRYLLIAKPFLGVFGSISLCLFITDGSEPPETVLSGYAFLAALLSSPILQNLLAVASVPKNQVALFNAINPFRFKIVAADKDGEQKK